jgi:hypothetical protein
MAEGFWVKFAESRKFFVDHDVRCAVHILEAGNVGWLQIGLVLDQTRATVYGWSIDAKVR